MSRQDNPPTALEHALHELRNRLNNVHLQLVLAMRDLERVQGDVEPARQRLVAASEQLAAAANHIVELEVQTDAMRD